MLGPMGGALAPEQAREDAEQQRDCKREHRHGQCRQRQRAARRCGRKAFHLGLVSRQAVELGQLHAAQAG